MHITEQDPFSRLSAADVTILGHYLCGTRWKTALSRRLGISERIIRYWTTSDRPVSCKFSLIIAEMVGLAHANRRTREKARYAAMIESLSSGSARTLILGMLAAEIEREVLAGNGVLMVGPPNQESGGQSPPPAPLYRVPVAVNHRE